MTLPVHGTGYRLFESGRAQGPTEPDRQSSGAAQYVGVTDLMSALFVNLTAMPNFWVAQDSIKLCSKLTDASSLRPTAHTIDLFTVGAVLPERQSLTPEISASSSGNKSSMKNFLRYAWNGIFRSS
jgi:hypothetical protein